MFHVMIDFSRPQQGLGGDATPVEANAADVLTLDDRDFETQLCRADGGDITSWASANNQYVEVSVGHVSVSLVAHPSRLARARTSG